MPHGQGKVITEEIHLGSQSIKLATMCKSNWATDHPLEIASSAAGREVRLRGRRNVEENPQDGQKRSADPSLRGFRMVAAGHKGFSPERSVEEDGKLATDHVRFDEGLRDKVLVYGEVD